MKKKDIHTQSVIKNIHDDITSIKKSLDKVSEMNSKLEHNMSVKFDEIDMGFVEIEKSIDEIMSNDNANKTVEDDSKQDDIVEVSEENVKVEVTEVYEDSNEEVPDKEFSMDVKNEDTVDSIKDEVSKTVNEKKGGKKKNKNNSVNLEM